MFELLITPVVAVHLLMVNIAAAGPLVCIWLHRRENLRGDAAAGIVGRKLAKASLQALLLGMLLGVVAIWLQFHAGERAYYNAMQLFPMKKYWFSIAELVCSLIWTGAYLLLWNKLRNHTNWHALLALLTSTNLLYHFPPLLTIIAVVSTRPEWADKVIDIAEFRQLMIDPEVISRVVHVWLASVAAAGVYVMGLSLKLSKMAEHEDSASRIATWGARIALLPTLLQLLVGIWVMLSLPESSKMSLMGSDLLATGLLFVSIVLSFYMMHVLAAISTGNPSRKNIMQGMILFAVIVLFMTATLRRTRHLATPAVEPEAVGQAVPDER